MPLLPPLEAAHLDLVDETRGLGGPGFLTLRRQVLRVRFSDGATSDPFAYDAVERRLLDAVVIAAHYTVEGERHVYLRSALRPPVLLRPRDRPHVERASLGMLWELPAGLVELEEQSPEGLARASARELVEELGVVVAPHEMRTLGPSTFPAPGVIGERQFFFHVEVAPEEKRPPQGDGSALERLGIIAAIPLAMALDLAREGQIEDAKTELALRRLAEV